MYDVKIVCKKSKHFCKNRQQSLDTGVQTFFFSFFFKCNLKTNQLGLKHLTSEEEGNINDSNTQKISTTGVEQSSKKSSKLQAEDEELFVKEDLMRQTRFARRLV